MIDVERSSWRHQAAELLVGKRDLFTNPLYEERWKNTPQLRRALSQIIRRRLSLEFLIEHFGRKCSRLEPWVWASLLIGLRDLLLDEEIPDYAAIYEAVELAKQKSRRGSGFVNAVLRKVLSQRREKIAEASPRADLFPIGQKIGWLFEKPLFPHPEEKGLAYLHYAYSYPYWLIRKWRRHYRERLYDLLDVGNSEPPLFGRLHPRPSSKHWQRLGELQINWEKTSHPHVLYFPKTFAISQTALAQEGLIYFQDLSTVVVMEKLVKGLAPRKILDVGTAPGGKLLHLGALFPSAELVGVDVSKSRLQRVRENLNQFQVDAELVEGNIEEKLDLPRDFGLVVLDAPCTNTGVVRRRPQVRWRLNGKVLEELCERQRKMIQGSLDYLAPRGYFLYLTCSILPEENQGHYSFLTSLGLKLVREERILPSHSGGDGFFGSLWKKD